VLEQLLFASLHNLHLLEKTDKATVVSDLMGLQAQFANNPKYALQMRAADYDEETWAKGWSKPGPSGVHSTPCAGKSWDFTSRPLA